MAEGPPQMAGVARAWEAAATDAPAAREAGNASAGGQPRGALLATAPHPVRNDELMSTLRRLLHRPPAPPTPATMVRLGAVLIRTDPALGLTGRRAVPARLVEDGFTFRYPRLGEALKNLLHD